MTALPRADEMRLAAMRPTLHPENPIVQVTDAVNDLLDDGVEPPRYPYAAVDRIAGSLAPGRLTIVAANSGQGKTTFALDVMDRLVAASVVVYMLGLEQRPKELRTKWACLRADVQAAHAFEKRWNTLPNGESLRGRVMQEFAAQQREPLVNSIQFDPRKTINRAALKDAAEKAESFGAQVFIVDHIDRMDHGDGSNPFHELTQSVRMLTEIADDYAMHCLVFSQLNRAASQGDRIARYTPPQIHHLFGGSVKEHESDVILGLNKPIRPDATRDEIASVRDGRAEPSTILEPGMMCVTCLKRRLDGSSEGKRAYLSVHHGRLADVPERDRYVTLPSERGPRP